MIAWYSRDRSSLSSSASRSREIPCSSPLRCAIESPCRVQSQPSRSPVCPARPEVPSWRLVPTHADALPLLPAEDTDTDFVDNARHFITCTTFMATTAVLVLGQLPI